MPILNYRTKVSPDQTRAEIAKILVAKGATRISSEYDRERCIGLQFEMNVGGIGVHFQLPAKAENVAKILAKGRVPTALHKKHAEAVTWRILKDWIEAQVALIEAGQAEMAQVFMPYAISDSGKTAYELFVEGNKKLLGKGE